MAIPPRLPTVVQVLEIAKSFGMTLTEEDAASFRGLMAGSIASYARLDELVEPKLPVRYPRDPGYRPPAEENPYNAWYWKTHIVGADERNIGRRAGGGERQHLCRRRADDERLARARRLRSRGRCHGRHPHPRRRRRDRRQGGLRRSLLLGRQPYLRDRTDPQPAQPEALDRRLLGRQRGTGGRRRSDDGARRRSRRIDPHAIGVVRGIRPQADLGTGADDRRHADLVFGRSLRADVLEHRERRQAPDRDSGPRSA